MKQNATRKAEVDAAVSDDVDVSKLRVVGRGLGKDRRISLRTLRAALGVTQVELAAQLGLTQSQVSKIEGGQDHLISTLQRYADALGGELHVRIRIDGRDYRVG